MLNRFLLNAAILIVLATGPVNGQQQTTPANEATLQLPPAVKVPGADDGRKANATDFSTAAGNQVLLVSIMRWLSANFDLPPVLDPPRIALVPPKKLVALLYEVPIADRFSDLANDNGDPPLSRQSDIVAVYGDVERTIYLAEGWTGDTPAELSILVHEMVHHVQNVGGVVHGCRAAREKVAYAAQDRWLRLFGHDLASDFGIDPFTLLANTICVY